MRWHAQSTSPPPFRRGRPMNPTPVPALPRSLWRHRRPRLLALAAVLALVLSLAAALRTARPAAAAGTRLSQGKTATASSVETAGTPAASAVDGDTGTRWSSAASDPQWLQVDLGASATISQVNLNWEAAYAKSFSVQTSTDGSTWT